MDQKFVRKIVYNYEKLLQCRNIKFVDERLKNNQPQCKQQMLFKFLSVLDSYDYDRFINDFFKIQYTIDDLQ